MAPLSLTAAIKRLNQRLTMTDATLTLDGFAIAMDRILGLRHATSRRNLIAQETLYRCLHLVELSSSPEQDFERVDYSGRAEGSPRYSGMLWSSPALSRLYTRFRKPDEWDRYTHQVRTLITVVCKVSLKCYSRARSNNSRSLVPDHEAISSVSANYTTKSARLMEEIGGDERTHQLRT
ncbi:hypothetical protein KCV06_g625, partial [Aureobasidium melanogenum]